MSRYLECEAMHVLFCIFFTRESCKAVRFPMLLLLSSLYRHLNFKAVSQDDDDAVVCWVTSKLMMHHFQGCLCYCGMSGFIKEEV